MRPWNYVNTDKLADPSGSSGPGVGSRFNGSYIAADEYRHITGADVFFSYQLNIRGLNHCVGRLDSADESFGLDHSECF
jgi:hypothetical protein